MNDLELKTHIQNLIQPLYSKIQYLEKENSELKKRLDVLETQIMTQSTRGYMKNTASRQHHLMQSTISRREDDNRSVSGGKERPAWKSNTKIEQPKPVSRQPVHYEKVKLKPPIPRMNSKTPSKTGDSVARQKSPPVDKKIMGGAKIEAEKKQKPDPTQLTPSKPQSILTPTKPNIPNNHINGNQSPTLSKSSLIQLGQPNIFIQKDSKINSISHTPKQTTPLNRSNVTEKGQSKATGTPPSSQVGNTLKSQISIQ